DLGIRDAKAGRVWNTFTRVMDRANRSGVVVYSIDARRLQTGSLKGGEHPQPALKERGSDPVRQQQRIRNARVDRTQDLFDTQESLVSRAQQPGGFAVLNTTDLGSGLGRIIDDTRGYYLIGFETLIPTGESWGSDGGRGGGKR